MTNIIIRNLTDDVIAALDTRAEAAGVSRQQYLHDRLTALAARLSHEKTIVAGFLRLDYAGDVAQSDTCPLCGGWFANGGGQYLMMRLDARPPTVVCAACAGDYSRGD